MLGPGTQIRLQYRTRTPTCRKMRVTVSAGPARPSVAALASGALRYRGHRDGPPRIFKSWQWQSRSGQHHATQNSCVMEAGRDQHEAVPNSLPEGQRSPNVKSDPDGIQHASNPDKNRRQNVHRG